MWPRHLPQRILLNNGFYSMGAALVPAKEAVEGVFDVLMHYRDKVLQGRSTGAAEPGVDHPGSLSGEELGIAWAMWRMDFLQSPMNSRQEALKRNDPQGFNKQARSWHAAHVQQLIGDTHVAKALIQHGVPSGGLDTVIEIVDTVRKLKKDARGGAAEPAETRGGAAEPAEIRRRASEEQRALRRRALAARAELREGGKVHGLVDADTVEYQDLDPRQQRLYDEYMSHALHRQVDVANKDYGHGVARTNDYGVAVGEQMCQTQTLTQRTSALLQLAAARGMDSA